MTSLIKKTAIALLCAAPAFAAMPLQAGTDAETLRVMTAERTTAGKPPFKRTFREVPVADIAAAEPVETMEVTVVQRGANKKAPYRRVTRTIAVTDIAAMEVEESTKRVDFRGKPPFNRHR